MHIPEAGLPNTPPSKKPRKPKVVKQPEQTQLELAPQAPQEPELKALPPIELYSAQKFLKNAEFLLDKMPSILNRLDGSIPVTKAILRSRMLDPQKGVTVEELKQIMTYRTKVKEAVAAGILPADKQDVCSTFWDMYVAFCLSAPALELNAKSLDTPRCSRWRRCRCSVVLVWGGDPQW